MFAREIPLLLLLPSLALYRPVRNKWLTWKVLPWDCPECAHICTYKMDARPCHLAWWRAMSICSSRFKDKAETLWKASCPTAKQVIPLWPCIHPVIVRNCILPQGLCQLNSSIIICRGFGLNINTIHLWSCEWQCKCRHSKRPALCCNPVTSAKLPPASTSFRGCRFTQCQHSNNNNIWQNTGACLNEKCTKLSAKNKTNKNVMCQRM